jgi:hypothetical protein
MKYKLAIDSSRHFSDQLKKNIPYMANYFFTQLERERSYIARANGLTEPEMGEFKELNLSVKRATNKESLNQGLCALLAWGEKVCISFEMELI